MPQDVSLKSIQFKGTDDVIAGVKCNLTNGKSSPLIENKEQGFNKNPTTIKFDPNRPIRAVEAAEFKSSAQGKMWLMRFLDEKNSVICTYNPNNYNNACTRHILGENEELIGVYGVRGNPFLPFYAWFQSFGFIVKVKNLL